MSKISSHWVAVNVWEHPNTNHRPIYSGYYIRIGAQFVSDGHSVHSVYFHQIHSPPRVGLFDRVGTAVMYTVHSIFTRPGPGRLCGCAPKCYILWKKVSKETFISNI